jgi:hypothetical protein
VTLKLVLNIAIFLISDSLLILIPKNQELVKRWQKNYPLKQKLSPLARFTAANVTMRIFRLQKQGFCAIVPRCEIQVCSWLSLRRLRSASHCGGLFLANLLCFFRRVDGERRSD